MVCCANDLVIRSTLFNHLGTTLRSTILLLGNIHVNLPGIEDNMVATVKERLEPFVYEWVVKHGGSISAEHGIGMVRAEYKFVCYVRQ